VAENPTTPSPPPPRDQSIRVQIPIPLLVIVLLASGLVLWGLARIVPDVLAYTHGRRIDATVTRVIKARNRSPVQIHYEATTRDHGVVRGVDGLVTPWPPAVGDRVEVAYLAAGGWRHPIVMWRRNWLNALFLRVMALGTGGLCLVSAYVAHRAEQQSTALPPER
jgi:hypothetical protein